MRDKSRAPLVDTGLLQGHCGRALPFIVGQLEAGQLSMSPLQLSAGRPSSCKSLFSAHLGTPSPPPLPPAHLAGPVVKASASRAWVRIPLAPRFFRGRVTPVTSKLALQWLPCQAPGVLGSVLGLVGPVSLGEVESLICNFYLSVAARKIVCADPSLRYTSMLL